MEKGLKIYIAVVVPIAIVAIAVIYHGVATVNEREKEILKQRAVVDVIMIQEYRDHSYTIVLNGYDIQKWLKGEVCVKIDPYVSGIKAEFTPYGSTRYYGTPVTLIFASKEEAKEALGAGYSISAIN